MKRDGLFDVTVGAYTEVCEVVGTFLLDKISVKYDENSIGGFQLSPLLRHPPFGSACPPLFKIFVSPPLFSVPPPFEVF